jgi:F0F1-type ATP synthase assembly protein I
MVEPRGGGFSGAEFAGIGIQFALVILVFSAAGIWLDRRLGTSPWLLILFVFLGAGGQFFSLYRKAQAAQRRDAERRARERAGSDSSRGTGR